MGLGGVCLLACLAAVLTPATQDSSPHSKASAYVFRPEASERTYLAFRLVMEPQWHSYWKNPGDSGMAIGVDWQVPDGVEIGEPLWPTPHRISADGMMTYGYEDDVVVFYPVLKGAELLGNNIVAKGSWLICKDMCLPANASPRITNPSDADLKVLKSQYALVPTEIKEMGTAEVKDGKIHAVLTLGTGQATDLYAFVEEEAVVAHSKPQKATYKGAKVELELPLSPYATELPPVVHFVLSGKKDGKPFAYRFAIQMQSTMEELS